MGRLRLSLTSFIPSDGSSDCEFFVESVISISLDAKEQSFESRRRSIVWHRTSDYKSPYHETNENDEDLENDEIEDFFDALNK